jgi:carboxyl-terminal processing protease
VKERYVDPSRIDPKKMLYQALDSVQFNIPEVLVAPNPDKNEVAVTVNDKTETFQTDDVDSPWRLAAKLKKIFRFVQSNMNQGADLAQVEYAAVNGMLSTLDPHSTLLDPEAAREMDLTTSGKFGGLGIVIRMIDKKLTVIRPMKDTPAWRAGIKAGDHIVKINTEPTENLTSNEAVDRMRGEPKTAVTLWVERKGTTGLLRFDLQRDVIRLESVVSKLLDKNVGYIRIKQFSSTTAAETAQAMDDLASRGAKAWVLDLRWNPGGLLEQAVETTDLFVDSGTIVTTVSGKKREPHRAERGPGDPNAPLAVLVNNGSASASEIVAGALKNLDRGVIIGTRTFGKGSVQELYDNEDGSKLKITVAEYLTPGDRSIQNLGIVPDIALERMYVPDKDDAPDDIIRLLPPTHSYGEKDLDRAIVSAYARDTDRPSYELPFLFVKPVVATKPVDAGADGAGPAAGADDEPVDEDEIKEDFEIDFGRDVVATASNDNTRSAEIKDVKRLVAQKRVEQDKALADALTKLAIDWSAPPANQNAAAKLEVSVTSQPGDSVHAGDLVTLTGTVKNTGTVPAWRVQARLHADDPYFDDYELVFGKLAPGETKTFTQRVQLPKDAVDRVDQLTVDVKEAKNAPAMVQPLTLKIAASPRPTFAFGYDLIDDGNGDGLVQKGEKYRLHVTFKNAGAGTAAETTALLRNDSGDGLELGKSRFELGELKPGDAKDAEFSFQVGDDIKGPNVVVELAVYDAVLGTQETEKLTFPLHDAAPAVTAAQGMVEAKKKLDVRGGADDSADVVATASAGARMKVTGTTGTWTRVDLGGRPGFVPTAAVSRASGSPAGTSDRWQVTPPNITLSSSQLEVATGTYSLAGSVSDDQHVEDVYVFVSNPGAKIDGRKVYYKSNRGGAKDTKLDFKTDVPLWPGSNQITVVARENADVRSLHTFFVFRDGPVTAQVTPAPSKHP